MGTESVDIRACLYPMVSVKKERVKKTKNTLMPRDLRFQVHGWETSRTEPRRKNMRSAGPFSAQGKNAP